MSFFDWLQGLFCVKYEARITELEKNNNYYFQRLKLLEELIARSIEVPKITIEQKEIFKPYYESRLKTLNLVCADLEYYKLPLEKWKEILTEIYERFKKVHPYQEEVFDCDDFALLYAGLTAYTIKLVGLDKQVAFAIAWSDSHAFNLFITIDNKIYIYEPQNNNIVGELESINKPYDVRMIWFMS